MGAKQSKRSVDISGKEADGAGEVAAAGAGGEGRVEQLADPDALKAQINGDAHIHEPSDKEKDLDSGTPENEKDATTEKEGKESEGEKESTPITNGEGDQKTENGETTPTEEGKKPKKEKVKKKWSLRSISFSRKDKPKQEKKQKEEEPKANGEPEKVPEETVDTTSESPVNEVVEEVKPETETKEEKAPETPVTEPITNGSSTPESPKVETPVVEESVVASPEIDRPEPKGEIEPEQLPVNGLSLVEPIQEISEVESKIEEIVENKTETTDVVPVPEIPVIKEVCVTQLPLIEPSPPPLPANPPPSCVASFAATTMAPELTAASLSNTETAITTPSSTLDVNVTQNEPCPDSQTNFTNIETVINDPIPIIKESIDEKIMLPDNQTVDPILEVLPENLKNDMEIIQPLISEIDLPTEETTAAKSVTDAVGTGFEETITEMDQKENVVKGPEENIEVAKTHETLVITPTVNDVPDLVNTDLKEDALKVLGDEVNAETIIDHEDAPTVIKEDNIPMAPVVDLDEVTDIKKNTSLNDAERYDCNDINSKSNATEIESSITIESEKIIEPVATILNDIDDLPPPPPLVDLEIEENITTVKVASMNIPEIILQTDETSTETMNEDDGELEQETTETSKEVAVQSVQCEVFHDKLVAEEKVVEPPPLENVDVQIVECDKVVLEAEELLTSTLPEESESGGDLHSESVPPPPSAEVCQTVEPSPPGSLDALPLAPQDPISEKIIDLIPEVAAVPELKNEMLQETSNDVVVAN